jgi:hypothetical protein
MGNNSRFYDDDMDWMSFIDEEPPAKQKPAEVKKEDAMPYSAIEKQRILLQAKRKLGKANKSDASDKRIFIDQCVDDMTSSGDADDEDEARDICLLLWDEGDEAGD